MAWTRFMDMHSGGPLKTDWQYIYIEAPETEAIRIFQSMFGQDPNAIACECCGYNFSISEEETLAQASAFDRGCDYVGGKYVERVRRFCDRVIPLDEYVSVTPSVRIISASDIADAATPAPGKEP
jgi:hypothetical protein